EGCQVVGVDDVPEGLLEQILTGVADDGAILCIDAQEPAGRVVVDDADGGVLESAAEPLLAVAQLRDVGAGAEPFDDIPAGVADRYAARLEPSVLAVAAADTVFHVVRVVPRHGLQPEVSRPLAVLWVQRPQPAPAEQLRLRDAGVLCPLGAEIVAGAVGCRGPDQLRQRL